MTKAASLRSNCSGGDLDLLFGLKGRAGVYADAFTLSLLCLFRR